jgi:hypothetical protein
VGKNTATPSTKYVLKTLMNYRQKKKQTQTKIQIKVKENHIRSVEKENEKGGQLKICGVR